MQMYARKSKLPSCKQRQSAEISQEKLDRSQPFLGFGSPQNALIPCAQIVDVPLQLLDFMAARLQLLFCNQKLHPLVFTIKFARTNEHSLHRIPSTATTPNCSSRASAAWVVG